MLDIKSIEIIVINKLNNLLNSKYYLLNNLKYYSNILFINFIFD